MLESGDSAEPFLRLLDAYCAELGGDVAAAEDLYREIAAADPRASAAHEALFRLRDIESLAGEARARRKERAFAAQSAASRSDVAEVDTAATPVYPPGAYAAAIQGWVLLDYAVRSDGTVTDVVALESEPPFVFDRAAVATVGQWIYAADVTRETFRKKLRYEFRIDRIGLPRVRDDY